MGRAFQLCGCGNAIIQLGKDFLSSAAFGVGSGVGDDTHTPVGNASVRKPNKHIDSPRVNFHGLTLCLLWRPQREG